MDGQREARKREPADMQMEKGEKILTFEIINYHMPRIKGGFRILDRGG